MRERPAELWVVYKVTIHGRPTEARAVCEQGEWDAMQVASPGHHKFVRKGIASEPEAERLARAGVVATEAAKLLERKLARRG